jgi:hypothetical protein
MTDSSQSTHDRTVLLQFQRPDGWSCNRELHHGQTLTIGSRESCAVHLPGDSVAPIHCVLKLQGGQLWVQDWYSSTGTMVNGEPISEETPVPSGSTVCVGEYTIATDGEMSAEPWSDIECEKPGVTPAATCPDHAFDPPSNETVDDAAARISGMEFFPDEAEPALAASLSEDCVPSRPLGMPQAETAGEPSPLHEVNFGSDPFDDLTPHDFGDEYTEELEQETVDLLRAEVEQLQCELTEREQELEALRAQAACRRDVVESIPISEPSPALVDRMEELLQELERSDHRIAQLEEVLRCAEEAARAEHDERQHLEAWFNDIEKRVSQRESEWKAEEELLQQRLAETTQKTRRLEEHLRQSLAAGNGSEAHERELKRLREENQRLGDQLQNAQRELQQRSAATLPAAGDDFEQRVQTEVDARLREEQIQMAQDRAVLARQKAELVNMRGELENLAKPQSQKGCDIDARVRGFREHLREIHSQEQPDTPNRSLTRRVADLWRRLDGRG